MRGTALVAWWLTVALGSPAPTSAENAAPLALTWRLIENQPENRYLAELTLQNTSESPLAPRWRLYFNSSSRLFAETVEEPFVLEHVNGDFYRLRPDESSPPIGAGQRQTIQWLGGPWAINVSDAPSGFYIVQRDKFGIETSPAIVPLTIAPFLAAAAIRRGGGDELPVVTAESRFAQNAHLKLLPIDELPAVVPTPIRTTRLPGRVTVDATTMIVHEPELAGEAQFLAASLQAMLGKSIAVVAGSPHQPHCIRLALGELDIDGQVKRAGDEAYRLTARPDAGVEIVGTDTAGVFYGIQTLRALLPLDAYRGPVRQLAIDGVRIEDAPRFGYRGLHLDVARNFHSPPTVKKLLDVMAFYKLNRFHLHLTDDEGWRIEIKALPELTAVGGRRGHTIDESSHLIPSYGSGPFPAAEQSSGSGFYTQDELIEILRFAHDRHITVIPELDFPGHARAAIRSMTARARKQANEGSRNAADDYLLVDPDDKSRYESVQMWRDNVVDVCRESTYRFLDVVVGELADVYRQAGVPLPRIHLGGDEVPDGAWEASPACRSIAVGNDTGLARGQRLQLYFLDRSSRVLAEHGVAPACWEDCLLFATAPGSSAATAGALDGPLPPTVYVWNNVWGWGREDAAYRLANAGYDVVLANATHLYFDLAYEKDPLEPGYYWAGFVDMNAPFEFNPFDVFQNARADAMGRPLAAEDFSNRVRLTDEGRRHILGIQGQLWSENLRSRQQLEYMAFPRTIALAERAWAATPKWTMVEDPAARDERFARAWNRFANLLGQRELPRLDWLAGGIEYRLPPPGAVSRDGLVLANVALPGLTIRFSTDGSDPTEASPVYQEPIAAQGEIRLRSFDTRGRGSRAVAVSDRAPQ